MVDAFFQRFSAYKCTILKSMLNTIFMLRPITDKWFTLKFYTFFLKKSVMFQVNLGILMYSMKKE